jgi:serine/threonine protein kinase
LSAGQPVDGRFPPGAAVAGYRIEGRIGRGGMATVFRAHDERLGRTVALKVLAPALAADEEFRARFIRESRAAAATDHPHIIPVYAAGEADGVLFIAMRFVRGGDLRWHLGQSGPLALPVVADIVSQTASALDAAHKRGLVHRDIKPANLLLDVGGEVGRPDHVYLSDFGLSKDSISAGTLTALTVAGQVIGTLDYMAPEQIEGRPVDGRADQYGLACTMYELLCGTPPFGEHPRTALMRAHRTDTPPRITSRRGSLPRRLDAVFARALAKAPLDRYGSCLEFATALRATCGVPPYRPDPQVIPARHQTSPRVAAPPAAPTPPVIKRIPAPMTPAPPVTSAPPVTRAARVPRRAPAEPVSPVPPVAPPTVVVHRASAATIRKGDIPAALRRKPFEADRTELDRGSHAGPPADPAPAPATRRWSAKRDGEQQAGKEQDGKEQQDGTRGR